MELIKTLYCCIMVIFGITTYLILYKKSKDILNPFGIVILIWCVMAGLANLTLSRLESIWTLEMYIISTVFPVLLVLIWITGKLSNLKKKHTYEKIEFGNCYLIVSRMIFVICIICVLKEFAAQKFLITFSSRISESTSDTKSLVETLAGWHYGTVFFPYCSLLAVYEFCFAKNQTILEKVLLSIAFTVPILQCVLVTSSRGTLLVILLGSLYILSRRYKIKLGKLQAMIISIVIFFIWMAERRIWSTSLVYNVIEGHPLISSVYSYTVLNFNNLNKLTMSGPSWTIMWRSLGGIVQILGLYDFVNLPEKQVTNFFNATPICYGFYDDLGLVGVVAYTFIIYGIVKYFYRKTNENQNYMILFAALQKSIWMSFFGNYFCEYRIILFPYLVMWVVVKSMDYKICVKDLKIYHIRNKKLRHV